MCFGFADMGNNRSTILMLQGNHETRWEVDLESGNGHVLVPWHGDMSWHGILAMRLPWHPTVELALLTVAVGRTPTNSQQGKPPQMLTARLRSVRAHDESKAQDKSAGTAVAASGRDMT
jgi:hypothetical protein